VIFYLLMMDRACWGPKSRRKTHQNWMSKLWRNCLNKWAALPRFGHSIFRWSITIWCVFWKWRGWRTSATISIFNYYLQEGHTTGDSRFISVLCFIYSLFIYLWTCHQSL